MNFISYLMQFPFFSRHFPSFLRSLLAFLCATSEEIFTFFILLLVLLIDFRHPFTPLSNRAGRIAKEKLFELHSRFYFSRFDFTRFMCIFMPSNFIFTRVKCWAFIAVELDEHQSLCLWSRKVGFKSIRYCFNSSINFPFYLQSASLEKWKSFS